MTPSSQPTVPTTLSLEQQICYWMHTTVRAFDAVYRELLADHALSYPQYIALMTVGKHGPLTVGALGEQLRLDSGTLSPLLKRWRPPGSSTARKTPPMSDGSSSRSRARVARCSTHSATCR